MSAGISYVIKIGVRFTTLDFKKYVKNEESLDFIQSLYEELTIEQSPVRLSCLGYGFQIDPCGGGAEVWHLGQMVGLFNTIDDLFLRFQIDGKPFIERVSELDYE